jgi:glycosyltransferase involved in cell wall biosynthesis
LIPIKKGLYEDVIWENYFAPGLGAHRRDLLPLVSFYRSPLTHREITRRMRKQKSQAVLDTSGFDFVVFQKPSPVRVSPGTIKIIRCHDLVPLLRFDTQPASRQLMRDFSVALAQCVEDSYFACVSEATRDELLAFYPGIAGKVFVIPNSVTLSASGHGTKTPVHAPESYFLAVGTIEPRKNYGRLLDAFRAYRLTQPHPSRLVLVGNPGWRNEKELSEIARAIKEGWLEWHKDVSPERLIDLYRGAYALVCCSMHEGFGIPPIEAASLGVPSVLSDLAVFRTHFGDAAEYFDPYDPASMAHALARLNPARRTELQAMVRQKARLFGPEQELALWQGHFSRLREDKSAKH